MYIPELWCGVGATVLLELIALFVAAFSKKKKSTVCAVALGFRCHVRACDNLEVIQWA